MTKTALAELIELITRERDTIKDISQQKLHAYDTAIYYAKSLLPKEREQMEEMYFAAPFSELSENYEYTAQQHFDKNYTQQ